MNLGLTKFQNDYILAGETFSRSYVPSLLDEPNLVLHLLSDLSFRAYFEFKQIWLLCFFHFSTFVQGLSSFLVKFSGYASQNMFLTTLSMPQNLPENVLNLIKW